MILHSEDFPLITLSDLYYLQLSIEIMTTPYCQQSGWSNIIKSLAFIEQIKEINAK